MIIRKALTTDAKRIAWIHTASWRFAYKNILPDSVLDNIDIQMREENWEAGIRHNSPDAIRLVIEIDGEVEGFVCGLANRDKELVPEANSELWAIYISPTKAGAGLGTSLLKSFKKELREFNKHAMIVWCLKDNKIGRNFYEKLGARLLPQIKYFKTGDIELEEVCYVFNIT